ncbi:MAG: hypothetical protein KF775_09190 [Cyclobacteriaceae bacterium]|nr:hypothetical protein [Cyclobacteriaceae bacterium]
MTIPAFHVSSKSQAEGTGKVFIDTRKDVASSGIFEFNVFVQFNPASNDYPTGSLRLKIDLSDSVKGTFTSTSFELVNSYGKHNPTIFFTGRGKMKTDVSNQPVGLRFWFMIADNGKGSSPKVAGFAIHDRKGNRVAYGTGALVSGNVIVDPN